jgi:hypothetical protein
MVAKGAVVVLSFATLIVLVWLIVYVKRKIGN